MQNTTHYNLKKPDYTDFADVFDINDNMDTIDAELAAPTGDGRDQTVSFTDADLDSGITSFPTFLTKIVSGMKMAKFIRDFKAGMAYVLHVGNLVNNATCTESGKALDARMGKTLQDQITSLNDSLANYADGELITNANNAPLGFSCLNTGTANNPFPNFWCTILTMKGGSNSDYTQQMAFPWAADSSTKIAYRVCDGGSWQSWKYHDDTYVQSSLTLNNGLSWNGYQTIQFFGQIVVIHINFWSTTALSSGATIVTLPSSRTYTFPANYAAPISGSTGSVCMFNVSSAGVMTIGTSLAANAHVDLLLMGRAV